MARTTPRPSPTATRTLQPLGRHCPLCGETMWAAYHNSRTITTLDDVVHLTLQIRRCLNRTCPQFRRPYRPEVEGRLALPKYEFGLDVIAWDHLVGVGEKRLAQHQTACRGGLAVITHSSTSLQPTQTRDTTGQGKRKGETTARGRGAGAFCGKARHITPIIGTGC